MPRTTMVPDPNPRIQEILLGTKTRPVDMAEVARRTGYAHSTLCRYRKKPETLPLTKAIEIARAMQLRNEDWIRLLRG